MNPCKCLEKIQENLKAEGLAIAQNCQTFRVRSNKLTHHIGFPLRSTDGKKPKRGKATFLFLSNCPFCGAQYPEV